MCEISYLHVVDVSAATVLARTAETAGDVALGESGSTFVLFRLSVETFYPADPKVGAV